MSLKSTLQKKVDKFFHFAFCSKPTTKKYLFDDRSKGFSKLLLVLAGYKNAFWDDVFARVQKFVPDDFDICIISSGVNDPALRKIAEKNNWSYLSCKRNNINLTQNTAISLFPKAETIVKMDEDIFLTKDSIANITRHFIQWKKDAEYEVGVVSPLINVNGYAYLRLLKKFNAVTAYEKQFGRPRYYGRIQPIEEDYRAAEFMWGAEHHLPTIDEMNKACLEDEGEYTVIPVRLSIGCFVMDRNYWKKMNGFPVHRLASDFARDEEAVNQNATILSQAMLMDESTVVGHLGFGNQTPKMTEFYHSNPELFKLK